MKTWFFVLFFVALAGCQTTQLRSTETVAANFQIPTSTSFSTPPPTLRATLTSSIKPSPISTTCPIVNTEIIYEPSRHNVNQSIVDFLDAGGNPDQFKDFFETHVEDLNKDTKPEIIVIGGFPFNHLLLLSCINGAYENQLPENNTGLYLSDKTEIMAVEDLNKNGLPEVVFKTLGCLYMRCGALFVIEWKEGGFSRIIKEIGRQGSQYDYADMSEPQDAYLDDLENDGTPELIWTGEVTPDWHGEHWGLYPQRLATHVYRWDGEYYAALPVTYSSPEFRFQAVQDGDRFSLAGEYEKAIRSYQLAIDSEDLDWWTESRWVYLMDQHGIKPCAETGTPCPPPTSDPKERPILSAYATYRIMLINLLTKNLDDAEKTYQKIFVHYPSDNPGHVIAEMAILFWQEYQDTNNIADACALAIDYAVSQPEMLKILSGSGHSGQDIVYERTPSEVCPF